MRVPKLSVLSTEGSGHSLAVKGNQGAKHLVPSQLSLARQGQKKKQKRALVDHSVPIITEGNWQTCTSTSVPVLSYQHLFMSLFRFLVFHFSGFPGNVEGYNSDYALAKVLCPSGRSGCDAGKYVLFCLASAL